MCGAPACPTAARSTSTWCVASLGSIRNIEWLEGAGLAAGLWGVGCDAGCRAFDVNGVVTDSIFVAGDIARAPHVLYEYQFLAMEHWDNAVLGAEVAAHNMVSLEPDRRPHLLMPGFWSGQFGVNIKSVGVPPSATRSSSPRARVKHAASPPPTGAGAASSGRHLQPRQMAGLLRGPDRRSAPFPPPAAGLGSAGRHEAGPGRFPGPAASRRRCPTSC